jgi:hypothetical protein
VIGDQLTHRVSLVRRAAVMESGEPVLDEDGHIQYAERRTPGVDVAIQPLSTKERAAQHQAGVTVSSHRIYALVNPPITSADAIDHDPEACPMSPDLPAVRYEINGVEDAAGLGHHLEINATEIGPSLAPATAGSSGSGSGAGAGSGSGS